MKVLDWDYKDGEVPENLFSKLTNTELEKCYRSRIRVLAKRKYEYEPYNDMIKKYEKIIESSNPLKVAKAICEGNMFDEIAHRFFKITRLSGEMRVSTKNIINI